MVRAALERSGLNHGPISVHDKMASMGLDAPSPAWLAKVLRQEGVARRDPSEKPRAAWRRFVHPADNSTQLTDDLRIYIIVVGCVAYSWRYAKRKRERRLTREKTET